MKIIIKDPTFNQKDVKLLARVHDVVELITNYYALCPEGTAFLGRGEIARLMVRANTYLNSQLDDDRDFIEVCVRVDEEVEELQSVKSIEVWYKN